MIILPFQRLWISAFHGFHFCKEIEKGQGEWLNKMACPFSVFIYLLLFIMAFLLKLVVRPNPGLVTVTHRPWSTSDLVQISLSLTRSCIALRILVQYLHVPKMPYMGYVSSVGSSSSYAFFAHITPSGTAIKQAHSILRGREKGTEQRGEGSQRVEPFYVAGIQNDCHDFAVWHFQLICGAAHAFQLLIQHVQYCITCQCMTALSVRPPLRLRGHYVEYIILYLRPKTF